MNPRKRVVAVCMAMAMACGYSCGMGGYLKESNVIWRSGEFANSRSSLAKDN